MALFQVNHVQEYLGQTVMNRYFYNSAATDTVANINDLLAVFETDVVPLVNRLQVVGLSNVRLDGLVVEGISFSVLTLSGGGLNAGEPSPSWNQLSFLMSRTDRSTKSGGKRIGGISESNMINNDVFPDPTFEGWLDDYATILSAILVGALFNYAPFLVSFEPLDPGVIRASQPVASASFSRLSTQNTRKP
jgi:hypothetical protein